jgi:hypothetical protein
MYYAIMFEGWYDSDSQFLWIESIFHMKIGMNFWNYIVSVVRMKNFPSQSFNMVVVPL